MIEKHFMQRCRAMLAIILGLFIVGCDARESVKYQSNDSTSPATIMAWPFDDLADRSTPPGATVFAGAWTIRAESDAPSAPNALCQTGQAEFPALSLGDTVYGDVVLAARIKPISGRTDQAAGLLARIQDKDNYYILRANALENNVNLYKYAGGRRSSLKEGRAQVPS